MPATILAGDVGATHTRLGAFAADPRVPVAFESYASHEHAGLDEMVQAFLLSHPADLGGACFGVAGMVQGGHVKTLNLAWQVDAASLARVLRLESVSLINDLAAKDAHVSYEHVCSGMGLLNVYRFLRGRSRAPEPAWLAGEIATLEASAAISRAALEQQDQVCVQALDLMVSIYGAEAGTWR
jgi:glucokinase